MKLNLRREPLQDTPEGGSGGTTDTKEAGTLAGGTGDTKETKDTKETTDGKGKAATGDGKKSGEAATTDDKKNTEGNGETGSKAGDTKTPKAPAKYALTIPEGGRMDESDRAQIEEAARKADLTNEEAQAWIDEQDTALAAQSERFRAETKADKELGGDKLEQTTLLARAGIDKLFPKGDVHREGFLKFLNRGGAGNNIHVVRALARLGKLIAEDTAAGGNSGGDGGVDPASKLYNNS
jgi:hypothetical protein